jgi:integrase
MLTYVLCFAGLNLRSGIDQQLENSGVDGSQFRDLPTKMADFLVMSRSDSTNVKYLSYFKKWEQFITSKGGSAIPASPIHLALNLTELIDKSASSSIIASTVYGVKWVHSLRNLPDPTDNLYIKNLLEASKRMLSKPVCKKEPISVNELITLCSKYAQSTDILVLRDLCMILLAFAGFLRFDELVHLYCNDIIFYSDYFSIYIRKCKTDQYREGHKIVISKGVTLACPYAMLKRYLEVTKMSVLDNVFLFRPCYRSKLTCGLISKNRPLSYTRTRETVIARLREVVGDLNIGLHSLRSGGATAAANAGVNDRCWKRHGRWRSESSKDGYVVDSVERRLTVSKSLTL